MVAVEPRPLPSSPEHPEPPALVASDVDDVERSNRVVEAARARAERLQAEAPAHFASLGVTVDEYARVEAKHFLAYARSIEREHPEELAALGMTAEEYAAGMVEPGLTIDASIAAGLMSAAEGHYLQGCATREDLGELGYAPAQIEAILKEQRARACVSSS